MVLILPMHGSHSAITAVDQGDRHQQINSSVWRGLQARCCRYAHHVSAPLPHSVWLTLLHFRAQADWAVPGRRARSATCERTRTRQRRDDSGSVYAGEAPSSRSPRQWFLTFVFDQRAVELCRNVQCIDRAKKSAFRYNSTPCRTGKPTDPPTFVNASAPLCALFQFHYPHSVPIRILTASVVR